MIKKKNSIAVCLILILFSAGLPCMAQSARISAADNYRNGIESQSSEDWYTASEYFREALQSNPAYGDAWFHLAECVYQLGQYDLAVTYCANAQKYAPRDTQIIDLQGMAMISLGKLAEAKKLFNTVLAQDPNDVNARFGLAELELFDGRVSGAEKIYQDALRREGTNRKALLSLALVSAELGKNDAAMRYINQALQYHSGEAQVHYLAAYLAAQRGDMDEAERYARSAVQINGDFDKAYELLASVLFSRGKYSEAGDICDFRIGRDRNRTTAWYLKGMALYRQGKNDDALAAWTTGISIDPQDEMMRNALELQIGRAHV